MKHRRKSSPAQDNRHSTVDVWLCMACGLAFPFDSKELSMVNTANRHVTCVNRDHSRGYLKHVGDMPLNAARALCGPRFSRHDAPAEPPRALAASIGERTRVPVVLRLAPTPPHPADECKGCGEPLVDGTCPLNNAAWPHEVA